MQSTRYRCDKATAATAPKECCRAFRAVLPECTPPERISQSIPGKPNLQRVVLNRRVVKLKNTVVLIPGAEVSVPSKAWGSTKPVLGIGGQKCNQIALGSSML